MRARFFVRAFIVLNPSSLVHSTKDGWFSHPMYSMYAQIGYSAPPYRVFGLAVEVSMVSDEQQTRFQITAQHPDNNQAL